MILLSSIPILSDVVVVLALSIPVILLLHRLKLPSVIGFLVTGVLAGPYVLNLMPHQEQVDILAEIGVVLLLFTIGLEFSVPNLIKIKKAAFVAGTLQLVLTTLIFGVITYYRSHDYTPIAIFYGFLCTLSSTAIVLKILQMRGEMGTPHGQIILAILIFQDIAVVPMMLAMPMLAGQADNLWEEIGMTILKMIGVGAILVVIAKFVMRRFLYMVAATRSKELFISSIVVICFSIAYLTSLAGLSLALGAFLAGLVISESEFSHDAASYILPFKEIFTSIFFISIGMLMDISFVANNLLEIFIITGESIFIQAFMAFLAAKALRVPAKTAIMAGLAISQIGEFSFVLARTGTEIGLMPIELYQYFLAMSVLTMAFAPILIINSNEISDFIIKLPKPRFLQKWFTKKVRIPEFLQNYKANHVKDHMIIIGFGFNGRILAKGALLANIPYIVIEPDPRRVPMDSEHIKHILFGDSTNEEVLHHAHVEEAKLAIITVPDVEIAKMLTHKLKEINPAINVIVRNRRAIDVSSIEKAGADVVVTDELETNLAIFTQSLEYYYLPQSEILNMVSKVKEKLSEVYDE